MANNVINRKRVSLFFARLIHCSSR